MMKVVTKPAQEKLGYDNWPAWHDSKISTRSQSHKYDKEL